MDNNAWMMRKLLFFAIVGFAIIVVCLIAGLAASMGWLVPPNLEATSTAIAAQATEVSLAATEASIAATRAAIKATEPASPSVLVPRFSPTTTPPPPPAATATSTPTSPPTSTPTDTPPPTATPTPTPIPTAIPPTVVPNTPPGSVLELGQPWAQDGLELTLTDYDIDVDKLIWYFVLTNNTGRDLLVDLRVSDINMVDNLGVDWGIPCADLDSISGSLCSDWTRNARNGRSYRFFISYHRSWSIRDTTATGFTLRIASLSRISNAQWYLQVR